MRIWVLRRMVFCFAFGTCVLTHAQTQSQAQLSSSTQELKPSKTSRFSELNWDLEIGGKQESEGLDEQLGVKSEVYLTAGLPVARSSRIFLRVGTRINSSRVQEQFDEDPSTNRLLMPEAFFETKLFAERMLFSVGSHHQGRFSTGLLMAEGRSGRSFPGVIGEVFLLPASSAQQLKFFGQQAVPTSFSFNANRSEKEPLPSLRVLGLQWSASLTRNLQHQLTLGELAWSQLPSRVALASQKLGNTIGPGDGIANQQWVTGFQTRYLSFNLVYCDQCTWRGVVGYSRSQNLLAQSDSQDGQLFSVGLGHRLSDQDQVAIKLGQYFTESDLTPASYAPGGFGYTNRAGVFGELEWEHLPTNTKFFVGARVANPIVESVYQKRQTEVSIGVETNGSFLE